MAILTLSRIKWSWYVLFLNIIVAEFRGLLLLLLTIWAYDCSDKSNGILKSLFSSRICYMWVNGGLQVARLKTTIKSQSQRAEGK